MTQPLEEANELLLECKFCIQSLQGTSALRALTILTPEVDEELSKVSYLINHAHTKMLAYVEAMRSDRREKRWRYKKNKKRRTVHDTLV